jgi:tetratricopeptide (TPR) repeat protein
VDATWFDHAVLRARTAPDVGHLLSAYALLAAGQHAPAARRLLAADQDTDPRLVSLWMGRAAWAGGDHSGAAHAWRGAFGERLLPRTRLAEALYLSGEIDLNMDEAVQLLYLPGITDAQRTDIFDRIRHWIFWKGGSGEGVLRLCDRVLRPTPEGRREHLSDSRVANIWALRALSEASLGRSAEASQSFARAESAGETPYVQAVRARRSLLAGRTDEARRWALSAVAEAGNDGHALLAAGHVLLGSRPA